MAVKECTNTNDKNYTKVNITGKIKNSIWKQLYNYVPWYIEGHYRSFIFTIIVTCEHLTEDH